MVNRTVSNNKVYFNAAKMFPILTEFFVRHVIEFSKDIYATANSKHETFILLSKRKGYTVIISALINPLTPKDVHTHPEWSCAFCTTLTSSI